MIARRLYDEIQVGADCQSRPRGFVLTGCEASHFTAAPHLLAMPVGKQRLFLAGKGYDGDFLREELLIHGISPVILRKANRKNPPACDFRVYKDRNRIERMFNRIKQFRRIATRQDKTRKSFSAFLALVATKIWLPCFVSRTYLNIKSALRVASPA
nr:transposase [Peteryoungia ipomoeae]